MKFLPTCWPPIQTVIYAQSILIQTSPGNFFKLCIGEWQRALWIYFTEIRVPYSRRSDGGTWRSMFRPHSNSRTPRQGWGESNGDGPPSPTVNSQVLGGKRVAERGPKWDTCYLKIGLNFWKLKFFLSDSDSCNLWTKEINDSWKSRELRANTL